MKDRNLPVCEMEKCKDCGKYCTCKLAVNSDVKKEALVESIKAKTVSINSNLTVRK